MDNTWIPQYTNWRNSTVKTKLITDKRYLVLKMGDALCSTGRFGTYVYSMLNGIRFAIDNGYIPVIDWQHCKIPRYDAAKVGKENVWEYFFEQPFDVSLEQAYESEDCFVIDDVGNFAFESTVTAADFENFDDQVLMEWRNYFHKYIRLKKEIKDYFDKCMSQQMINTQNVIGIKARGTDYKAGRPTGHYSPIPEEELFAVADELLGRMEEGRIFLATEDKDILKDFESRYPGKVYSEDTERYHISAYGEFLHEAQKGENGYEKDLKFLYALYVISKCKACIYSACAGGILASLMRKEPGICYKFLNKGVNKPKGIVVGSYIEKEQGKIIMLGGKPVMFYALNTLKIIGIDEVDVIVTDAVKREYEKITGSGEAYGMNIHYVTSDTYNVVEYMACNPGFMTTSRVVLLYTDYFAHGNKIAKELSDKAYQLDGAYAWGAGTFLTDNTDSILIDKKRGIPEKAYASYKAGNRSLMGKYVFDYDLKEIVEQLCTEKKEVTLTDILNEYISRRKLFFIEYQRGSVYTFIKDRDSLKKLDQLIILMEEVQNQKIGDFEFFKRKSG